MPKNPTTYLTLTAIARNQPELLAKITHAASSSGASIAKCRLSALGHDDVLSMLIKGPWSALAKLESLLPHIEKELDFTLFVQRQEPPKPRQDVVPYTIQVIALDAPGIIYKITDFFARQNIEVEEINSDTYVPSHTDTTMFSLLATVLIPTEKHIATLRESFIVFCDDENLDAILEPNKS